MAINLLALGVTKQATLINSTKTDVNYKINADKIKADFKTIQKESASLLLQGGVNADDIKSIYTGKIDRTVKAAYGSEAFFSKAEPVRTDESGNFIISGVAFTKTELEQSRLVLQTAADSISAGIGKNTNLDYRNYAQMGIAMSTVRAYGKGLNEQQAQVVIKAMEEYNQALVDFEQELYVEGNFTATNYGDFSDYYGLGQVLDEKNVAVMNNLIDEMNRLSGGNRSHISAGYVVTVQSATNKELTGRLTELFSSMDITNESHIKQAFDRYKSLVTPAYKVMGFSNYDQTNSLNRILTKDITEFEKQIKTITSAFSYRAVDIVL